MGYIDSLNNWQLAGLLVVGYIIGVAIIGALVSRNRGDYE